MPTTTTMPTMPASSDEQVARDERWILTRAREIRACRARSYFLGWVLVAPDPARGVQIVAGTCCASKAEAVRMRDERATNGDSFGGERPMRMSDALRTIDRANARRA